MKKAVLSILLVVILIPAVASAQKAGAFVGAMGLGITPPKAILPIPAISWLDRDLVLAANCAFSCSMVSPSVGWLITTGSVRIPLLQGRTSFNFNHTGGLARLNLFHLKGGAIFVSGGGGIFTPNVHYYVPDNSIDEAADKSGTFFFGGLGLSSITDRKVIYEIEAKYNVGRDDYTLDNRISNVWDFIYVGMKISFASKGKDAPARY